MVGASIVVGLVVHLDRAGSRRVFDKPSVGSALRRLRDRAEAFGRRSTILGAFL
jgi:hypothetical protein